MENLDDQMGFENKDEKGKLEAKEIVEEKVVEEISEVKTKSTEKESDKKNSSKKKTLIGVGVAVAIAIVAVVVVLIATFIIIICFAMHRPTVNLNDYITIEVSGYDGYGNASYEFDIDKFVKDNKKKFKYNKRVLDTIKESSLSYGEISLNEKNINEYSTLLFLAATEIDGNLSETNGLSNGDTIVYSWYSSSMTDDEIAELAKKMRVKVKYSDIEYLVDNLREVSTFDPFEGVELSFSGISPNGMAVISSYPDNGLYYEIEGETEGLENGDTVVVNIQYPNGVEEYINEYQKKPERETKVYTVEDLGEYLTSASQIPEEYLEEMKAQANDVILGTERENLNYLDYNYIGNYFLLAKQSTNNIQNSIVLVYKLHYENTVKGYKTGDHDIVHDYYVFVLWDNLYFDEKGKFVYSKSNYTKTTDKHTTKWDIYKDQIAEIVDNKYSMTFTGYYSLEELYNVIILQNIEHYKFEENIVE